MADGFRKAVTPVGLKNCHTVAAAAPIPAVNDKCMGDETNATPLPTSALIPMENSPVDTPDDTPLRKALYAAAALATVTSNENASTPTFAPNYGICVEEASNSKFTAKQFKHQQQSKNTKMESSLLPSEPLPAMQVEKGPSCSQKVKATSTFPAKPPPFVPSTMRHPSITSGNFNVSGNYSMPVNPHFPSIPFPTMGAPGCYHQMSAAIKASGVPSIFRDRPQRSGKWTREEEAYAELLIELFDKGHIDEKNGSTLRSFLSRKLHCAPMRISKKYAGKGIGKMVFLSKCSFRGTGDGIGSPAYHKNMQRLRQAETAFYKSCFPELAIQIGNGATPVPPHSRSHMNSHAPIIPPGTSAPRPSFLPVLTSGGYVIQHQHHNVHPIAGNTTAASATFETQSPPPQPSAEMRGPFGAVPLPHASAKNQTPSMDSSTAVPFGAAKKSLSARESLEKANLSVKRAARQENTTSPSQVVPVASHVDTGKTNQQDVRTVQQLHYNLIPGDGSTAQGITVVHAPTKRDNSTDLPDFLSDFDKIAGQCNPNDQGTQSTYDPAQFSPSRYTTGSFDDFHRFLGKDITPKLQRQLSIPQHENDCKSAPEKKDSYVSKSFPPFPTTNAWPERDDEAFHSWVGLGSGTEGSTVHPKQDMNGNVAPRPPMATVPCLPENHRQMLDRACSDVMAAATIPLGAPTQRPHVADSYNIFAQQSAFAVSRHSAYMNSHGRQEEDGLLLTLGSGIEEAFRGNARQVQQAQRDSCNENGGVGLISMPTSARHATVVSEPSNASSDQGTDASDEMAYSGLDGNQTPSDGGIDSDGTYSESSRKRSRTSSDDEDIRHAMGRHQQQQQDFENLSFQFYRDFGY